MKKWILKILVCIFALSAFSGCSQNSVTDNGPEGQTVFSGWGPHMFNALFDSQEERADKVVETLLTAAQENDKELIKSIISPNVTDSITETELDNQIDAFCENFKGELTELIQSASTISQQKNDSVSTSYFEGTYSVKTTEADYLLALKLAIKNTTDPDEEGIHSIYIIEEEKHNSEFAYWGGDVWEPGIWIE